MAQKVLNPNVNPLDPAVIAEMKQEKEAIEEARQEAEENLLALQDAREGFHIQGLAARPLSAGVIAILEKIKHPLFTAGRNGQEVEMTMEDMVIILYLILAEDEDALIDQAMDGTLSRAALKWSFRMGGDFLQAACAEVQRMIEEYCTTAGTYTPPSGPEKKSLATG
jgi:hypothetical protein